MATSNALANRVLTFISLSRWQLYEGNRIILKRFLLMIREKD